MSHPHSSRTGTPQSPADYEEAMLRDRRGVTWRDIAIGFGFFLSIGTLIWGAAVISTNASNVTAAVKELRVTMTRMNDEITQLQGEYIRLSTIQQEEERRHQ